MGSGWIGWPSGNKEFSTLLVHNTTHKIQDRRYIPVIKLQNTHVSTSHIDMHALHQKGFSCHLLHTDLRRRLFQTLLNLFISRTIHGSRARRPFSTPTSKSNSLNLNRHTLRKLLNRNARASRLVGEVLLVDGVHLGEVVHGGDEDVDLEQKSPCVSNYTFKQYKTSFETRFPQMKG